MLLAIPSSYWHVYMMSIWCPHDVHMMSLCTSWCTPWCTSWHWLTAKGSAKLWRNNKLIRWLSLVRWKPQFCSDVRLQDAAVFVPCLFLLKSLRSENKMLVMDAIVHSADVSNPLDGFPGETIHDSRTPRRPGHCIQWHPIHWKKRVLLNILNHFERFRDILGMFEGWTAFNFPGRTREVKSCSRMVCYASLGWQMPGWVLCPRWPGPTKYIFAHLIMSYYIISYLHKRSHRFF